MKLCTKVVLITFAHRPTQNHLFAEYNLLITNHEKHPLNVLGVAAKSETDFSDILKTWLEYEKKTQTPFQESRSSNTKEAAAKYQVIARQLMHSNCLLAHTEPVVNERSFDLARSSALIFMNELNLKTHGTLNHFKLWKTLEFTAIADHN